MCRAINSDDVKDNMGDSDMSDSDNMGNSDEGDSTGP